MPVEFIFHINWLILLDIYTGSTLPLSITSLLFMMLLIFTNELYLPIVGLKKGTECDFIMWSLEMGNVNVTTLLLAILTQSQC